MGDKKKIFKKKNRLGIRVGRSVDGMEEKKTRKKHYIFASKKNLYNANVFAVDHVCYYMVFLCPDGRYLIKCDQIIILYLPKFTGKK